MRYMIVLDPPSRAELLFGPGLTDLDELQMECLGVFTDYKSPAARDALASADALVTFWGAPPLDDEDIAAAPHLRRIAHAGGSTLDLLRGLSRPDRLRVVDAGAVNAEPVAEFSLAMILLAARDALRAQRVYHQRRGPIDRELEFAGAGTEGKTLGIIAASRIGRRVIDLVKPFGFEVLVFDPFLDQAEAARIGVVKTELDAVFSASHIVSLHAPMLPETRHLVGARQLGLLREGGYLINTARGGLVDQDALIAELESDRINAILDVTTPDVLPSGSPLFDLPNVLLTPHIAGSMGSELRRLGRFVIDELHSDHPITGSSPGDRP